MIGIGEKLLKRLYLVMGYSDKEISTFLGVDRTAIVRLREKFGIESRKSIGELGEKFVIRKLEKLGYAAKDMNLKDKTNLFDILVDDQIKVEVKTAKLSNGHFKFTLTNKPENMNIKSKHRIILPNGRSKKILSKTCDLIVFIGVDENKKVHPYIIPSSDIHDKVQGVSMSLSPNNKYFKYYKRWDLIEFYKNRRDSI